MNPLNVKPGNAATESKASLSTEAMLPARIAFCFFQGQQSLINHQRAMIATRESFEPHSSEQLPKSTRIYVTGTLHPKIRFAMCKIELSSTKSYNGSIKANEAVRVYDCTGLWSDPSSTGTCEHF